MPSDAGSDGFEFLVQRYYELRDNQMRNNQIIHTTYYISIVFFGAMISFLPEISSVTLRLLSYFFSSGVFASMLLWTHIYNKNRIDNEEKINSVLRKIQDMDAHMRNLDTPAEFFPDPGNERKDIGKKMTWHKFGIKEFLLYSYYLGLSMIALVIAIVDIIIVI